MCVGYAVGMAADSSAVSRRPGRVRPARTAGHTEGATRGGGSSRSAVLIAAQPVTVSRRQTGGAGSAVAGSAPRRSTRADDPLAAERTRWLTDAVGGGRKLAGMLGVSPSQTSRWASGDERPGTAAAPLLIDLEHVLARVRLVWAEPAATTWLTSVNAHLGGARPVDVLRLRGPGPVLDALDAATWGSAA